MRLRRTLPHGNTVLLSYSTVQLTSSSLQVIIVQGSLMRARPQLALHLSTQIGFASSPDTAFKVCYPQELARTRWIIGFTLLFMSVCTQGLGCLNLLELHYIQLIATLVWLHSRARCLCPFISKNLSECDKLSVLHCSLYQCCTSGLRYFAITELRYT
jgi:hypothetical protein